LRLISRLKHSVGVGLSGAILDFLPEMGGGAAIGLIAGYTLLRLFRWIRMRRLSRSSRSGLH
jgi:NhaP-type Na+/H+ or K+/H+ antiporter